MSSHHVVRENQEPAVFFLSEKGCSIDVLQQALEWSPLVIATAESSQYLIERGIKVDVIFCKKETFHEISFDQSDVELITYEDDLLATVLHFLRNRNHKAVYIFSEFEKANQDQLANLNDLTINFFSNTTRWSLINRKVSKWFPKGQQLLVIGRGVKVLRNNRVVGLKDIDPTQVSGTLKFSSDNSFWLGEILT